MTQQPPRDADDAPGIVVVYDGDCPFCSQYVRMTRLRDSVGAVALINAREPHPAVQQVVDAGFDLDEGMAAIYRGEIYHGHACLVLMAALTSPSGAFNRLNALSFRHKGVARVLYPWLRAGRNVTLRLLGRRKLADGDGGAVDAAR